MVAVRFIAGCALLSQILMMPANIGPQGAMSRDSAAALAMARGALTDFLAFASTDLPAQPVLGEKDAGKGSHAMKLSARLDSAAILAPKDGRIMAIRVYSRVMSSNFREAERTVIDSCRDPEWWCHALLGFLRHSDGRFGEAQTSFRAALEKMPREKRCLWDDPSAVMNSRDFVTYYSAFTCEQRTKLTEDIWWLSQPLWMERGNERRTEHYSRWVSAEMLRIQSELLGKREFKTDVMHPALSAILRINDVEWYEGLGWIGGPFSHPDRFLPGRINATSPFGIGVLDFSLGPELASGATTADIPVSQRTRRWLYADSRFGELYWPRFGPVHIISDAQAAIFPRTGAARLLVAFNPRDFFGYPERAHGIRPGSDAALRAPAWLRLSFASNPLRVGVVVSAGPDGPTEIVTAESHSLNPIRMEVPATFDSAIVSVEARELARRITARHRFGVFRPSRGSTARVTLSDVLLFDATDGQLPVSVDAAFPRMLPRSSVGREENVGLFWELRGLLPGAVPEFEISVARDDSVRGALPLVANWLGLARGAGTRLIMWREAPIRGNRIGADGETAHVVALDFRSLQSGVYSLSLIAKVEGQEAMTVSRQMRIQ